jgi:HPt (histidine-containing phosphotransfer) domain-containing protein
MSFDEMLRSLQREYLSSIPEKIKIITAQIGSADTSNLRESFHKLKGTGRTYGLPEVSELGALVESICIEHPVNGLKAGLLAVAVLGDIHQARCEERAHDLHQDARMVELQKLLPK